MEMRVHFTSMLTVVTLTLSLVPAVIIWVVFMDLMTSSVNLLKSTTSASSSDMVQSIQELLMYRAMEKFDALLTEGEKEMAALVSMVRVNGMLAYDLWPSRFDFENHFLTTFHAQTFNTMQAHPLFSQVSIFVGDYERPNDTFMSYIAWSTWIAFLIDVQKNTTNNRTLYVSRLLISPDTRRSMMNITQVDQVSAKPIFRVTTQTVPAGYYTLENEPDGWMNTMRFNQYTGQVEVCIRRYLPAQNGTWMVPYISIGASTISSELLSQLSGCPNDRLVLFFRQPHGYMIAASHGKYFSNSDVDRRYINPLVDPINFTTYHLWTCLQSNDALISQACQQLYSTYQSWTAIPVLHQEMVLSGQKYWVATNYSSGNLQCTALMLKNWDSVMGSIDTSNAQVDQSVSDKKKVTFVILSVVSSLAVLLPLAVGLWLATRLSTLAKGMDRIAQLHFTSIAMPSTIFLELHRFQSSFTQMKRGLQAFGKYVPQAVVKVLIAGQMKANDEMHPEKLTIMFADIEGFSTICENETPSTLVSVCTEYFETMCRIIVQHNGTIDKFIGDCIMAIWNAPERLPGHERDAVAASLEMQAEVLELHPSWKKQGLPILKFRAGIHTAMCLVGNFGCSYRVCYTCLGDGVNLAARLEALNKKFGTYLCASRATYEGCHNDFHFRKLAKVTVPGKTEVLPVYEVVCETAATLSPKLCTPDAVDPPGTFSSSSDLHEPSEMSFQGKCSGYLQVRSPRACFLSELKLPPPVHVPYHWTYVDRTALLQCTERYEQAYEAMVVGDQEEARRLLMEKPLLDITDKATSILADQLQNASTHWDGVFRFQEK